MTDHMWQIDCIQLTNATKGKLDWWICHRCGCDGGPVGVERSKPPWLPYVAGTPLFNLPEDCAAAREIIDNFIKQFPIWKDYVMANRFPEAFLFINENVVLGAPGILFKKDV